MSGDFRTVRLAATESELFRVVRDRAGAVSCANRPGTGDRHRHYFAAERWRLGMSHWRKRNPPASRFNAVLAGWSIAFFVVFGTLLALSLHGRV
jgi:hypothetical protein